MSEAAMLAASICALHACTKKTAAAKKTNKTRRRVKNHATD